MNEGIRIVHNLQKEVRQLGRINELFSAGKIDLSDLLCVCYILVGNIYYLFKSYHGNVWQTDRIIPALIKII